jgi:hypothetical protein
MVHPAFHNRNLLIILDGRQMELTSRHKKVRNHGYRARAAQGLNAFSSAGVGAPGTVV